MDITFIGDMPRKLFSRSEWQLLCIDRKEARCGDVLFVKNTKSSRLLSHVAIILDIDQIFHCSLKVGKAIVQNDSEFFSRYQQEMNFKEMVRYIDRRNLSLRLRHNGPFILV